MANRTELTPAELQFVQQQRVARLATANEHGNPTLVPVCYAYDGIYFYTPLDQKPKRVQGHELRRVRNIEARPEVALLIDQYSDDWSQLGYVQIHGLATLIATAHPQHYQALTLLREKYAQYRAMALEQNSVIMISPQRIASWGPALSSRDQINL